MPHSIQAQTLHIKQSQTIELPVHTQLLGVSLDTRHNNCLLSTLEDKDREEKEKVQILMFRLYETVTPPNARHVGTFKDNSGNVYVFALKDSDSPLKPALETATKKVASK